MLFFTFLLMNAGKEEETKSKVGRLIRLSRVYGLITALATSIGGRVFPAQSWITDAGGNTRHYVESARY
jgi:hypothetical protein